MSRAVLAGIGGLALTVLLGALGLSEANANPELAMALFVCALSVGAVVAVALLATQLRSAPSAGIAAGVAHPARPAGVVDAEVLEGEVLERAVLERAVLERAVLEPAVVEAAVPPDAAVAADQDRAEVVPAVASTAGFRHSRLAGGHRAVAGSASAEIDVKGRSALLDALQEMHDEGLVVAIDGAADAAPTPQS